MKRLRNLLLALILDLTFGDPPNRFHPVVLMGNWLTLGRRLAPNTHRFWFGTVWTLLGIATFSLPWHLLHRISQKTSSHPTSQSPNLPISSLQSPVSIPPFSILYSLFSILALTSVFAYRNLRRSVLEVGQALAQDNLPEARRLTSWHLVSRDTSQLTAEEVAGAAIESLAENVTDSVTAPLLAYSSGGLPAAWAYRFTNTADAMWGYRTAEFEQLGKFAARLDDAFNWLPARLTGWALVGAAWLNGHQAQHATRIMLDQHNQTTSPNAGWTMSAMAGALQVTLTKREVYSLIGGTNKLNVTAIQRAVRLADTSVGIVVGLLGVGLLVRWWGR